MDVGFILLVAFCAINLLALLALLFGPVFGWQIWEDNYRSTEQQLRREPFTLLAIAPLALAVTAGITFTWVYSDNSRELIQCALISCGILVPSITLFVKLNRRELRKPFPTPARRTAWRIMFYSYLTISVGMILLAILTNVPVTKKLHLICFCLMGLPMGQVLFGLVKPPEREREISSTR